MYNRCLSSLPAHLVGFPSCWRSNDYMLVHHDLFLLLQGKSPTCNAHRVKIEQHHTPPKSFHYPMTYLSMYYKFLCVPSPIPVYDLFKTYGVLLNKHLHHPPTGILCMNNSSIFSGWKSCPTLQQKRSRSKGRPSRRCFAIGMVEWQSSRGRFLEPCPFCTC